MKSRPVAEAATALGGPSRTQVVIASMMQPYFFPYIGYFQLMAASDIFVFRDEVQYIKGGWINRNRVLDREGREAWITLPVAAASHRLPICERTYVLDRKSPQRLLRQIDSAYLRAPRFAEADPFVRTIMAFADANVAAFNVNLLQAVAARLGLGTRFVRSSELENEAGLMGEARVIDICRRLGATRYVNPIGGAALYDAQKFADNGVELGFLETAIEAGDSRHPFLSIVHVLMTESDSAIRDLLGKYRLTPGARDEGRRLCIGDPRL